MNKIHNNNSKTPLRWITPPNKRQGAKKVVSISEEVAKTYVPEIPSPIDESRMRIASKEKSINIAERRKRFSFTSENWIG